jgi:hypothetical protein
LCRREAAVKAGWGRVEMRIGGDAHGSCQNPAGVVVQRRAAVLLLLQFRHDFAGLPEHPAEDRCETLEQVGLG